MDRDRKQAQGRKVLSLTPGITGAASVVYRNEGELLATAPDPEQVYFERIMPEKIRLNLEYAARASLLSDVAIIMQSVFVWLRPFTDAPTPNRLSQPARPDAAAGGHRKPKRQLPSTS